MRNSSSFHKVAGFARLLGRAAVALLGCAILIPSARAIDPNRATSQYVRDRWGVEQGFPKGPVYAITQTSDGYLWIGTDAGLVRFDGWNFRLIRDESGAFTIASVLGLTPSDDGGLWIRLQDRTILRYQEGAFKKPSGDEQSYRKIEAMSPEIRGEVLMWKAGEGAFSSRGDRFEKLVAATELPPSPVFSILRTLGGDVWIGTRDAGLFRKTGRGIESIRDGLPDLKINSLLGDPDRGLWVGTDNGLVLWNAKPAARLDSLRHFQALAIVRDRDGNIWAGTDSRGLLRLTPGSIATLNVSDGDSPQAVTALFEDREGAVWIGHADGIERLRDSAFVTWSMAERLPADGSNPIFVDAANRLWFTPITGGLWWVRDDLHGRVTAAGLDRDVVYTIAGGDGELWVGRQRGGLTRLRFGRDSIVSKTWTQVDGLAQNSVYSVYRSRDGTVWAGTLSGGVSMLRGGRFTNFSVGNGLVSNTVASILESSGGTMWFATPNGLSALSRGRWVSYGRREGLPSEDVNCLLEDTTGVLWAGTASGIAFRTQTDFRVPAGLPAGLRAQILGIAEDRFGSLWMATSSRVVRVNRERLMKGALGDGDMRTYGLADGLRGLEGVKRHKSVVTDAAGRIWFSLSRGISVVDPARLTRNSAPALVHIQELSADGSAVNIGTGVHIPGGHQRITFSYSGLSLSVPDRVRYRYTLEGYDHRWSEPVAARAAGYTNLAPGPYRFRVMATNPDGLWGPSEAAVAFTVDPLVWQTVWFRSGIVLVCLAAILLFYRIRLGQFTARSNLRLQERLAERTRIAQELHDTLLQGFLSASMQVNIAADRLPHDSIARPTLTRALELMRQVIDEGRIAVRGLRSSQSVSLDLENAFSRIPQELLTKEQAGKEVEFRLFIHGEQKPLKPVLRDELYRIGREALLNAFRHAHAKKIEMEIKYSSRRLSILVRDDGVGIDPDFLSFGRDGHWGLAGMRERADRMGARLQVMSSASAGTEIELSVPAGVAFETVSDGQLKWRAGFHWRGLAAHRGSSRNGKDK